MSKEFRDFLKQEKVKAAKVIQNGDRYGTDNALGCKHIPHTALNRIGYEWSFRYLLGQKTFQQLIDERKQNQLPNHVLDLFGSGEFVTDMASVDSLTAIKLTDRVVVDDRIFQNSNYSLLSGNLYLSGTWHALSEHRRRQNIPGFDFIVCRPAAGFGHEEDERKFDMETYLNIYHVFLQRVYSILSPQNGTFFTKIPSLIDSFKFPDEIIASWQQKMNEAGLLVEYSDLNETLKIIKTEKSPIRLPTYSYSFLVNEVNLHGGFKDSVEALADKLKRMKI